MKRLPFRDVAHVPFARHQVRGAIISPLQRWVQVLEDIWVLHLNKSITGRATAGCKKIAIQRKQYLLGQRGRTACTFGKPGLAAARAALRSEFRGARAP